MKVKLFDKLVTGYGYPRQKEKQKKEKKKQAGGKRHSHSEELFTLKLMLGVD